MQAIDGRHTPVTGGSPWPTAHLPLADLRSFVGDVIQAMAKKSCVMTDVSGTPHATLVACGEDSRCLFRHVSIDLSPVGLPTNSPLNPCSSDGDTFIRWHLGSIPLAQTPKGITPEEAAC